MTITDPEIMARVAHALDDAGTAVVRLSECAKRPQDDPTSSIQWALDCLQRLRQILLDGRTTADLQREYGIGVL